MKLFSFFKLLLTKEVNTSIIEEGETFSGQASAVL